MTDYGEIRRTLRALNARFDALDGQDCPRPGCSGTVRRDGSRVVCEECGPAR